jgi:predicted transcriptional regulator
VQEGLPVLRRAGRSFSSLEVVRRVLTAKRIDLLRTVRREQPESIARLARHLGRDARHVHEDVDVLVRHGLVALRKGKTLAGRELSAPVVPYAAIELRIPV